MEIIKQTSRPPQNPILRSIANLWTFIGHPTRETEWTPDHKLLAIKEAGFDGVCWAPSLELHAAAKRHGLIFVGGMASSDKATFRDTLKDLKQSDALHVNVQLGKHDTSTPQALDLTLNLLELAKEFGLLPAIESHRGTCTETPEKTYALADSYQEATGQLLPISWDFSHFAVVKHLEPAAFIDRLLIRPDLIQRAQQFHFRPFNGHHAQVPITYANGELTAEVLAWIPFAEAVMRCWLEGNRNTSREIFICPELGPIEGGYALSTFPNSWEDAKVLRKLIDTLWQRVCSEDQAVVLG